MSTVQRFSANMAVLLSARRRAPLLDAAATGGATTGSNVTPVPTVGPSRGPRHAGVWGWNYRPTMSERRCAAMKLSILDGIASALVAAILVPYAGYLVRGEMPFIQDPRGMSATGLIIGVAAFLVAGKISMAGTLNKVEVGLAIVALAVGLVALGLAGTAAAEVLLAVFIGAIVVTWAVEMLQHAGILHAGAAPPALPHG